ncbi:MAG: VWA domain-containing protein [Desulfobulbaceae bacterium]|jgi:Ca-activated chloride channel family protein|nr:VWA domain-containing protein [Desulfobulbaceae bacterium]
MISKRSALAISLAALLLPLVACSPRPQTPDNGAQSSAKEKQLATVKTTRPSAPPTKALEAAAPVAEANLALERVAEPISLAKSGDSKIRSDSARLAQPVASMMAVGYHSPFPVATSHESYDPTRQSGFILAKTTPLSTFSIDVDTASYANVRRFINDNMMPPPGAARAEEMINYFHYDYPEPRQGEIAIHSELGQNPWRAAANLLKIGLKAKELHTAPPPSNLVFLIDVSGSMNSPDKLPLLQQALHMLTDELAETDRMAIVTYAGDERVALPSTGGGDKAIIHQAINQLAAFGSTHASAGIITAYQLAEQGKIPGGNNRVILASDGDFNVGVTSRDELEKLIESKRQTGVYLSALGFGTGNYKDDNMELLADKGNGNYNYIDSISEAKKVLVKERIANLFTLANDVKIQIEFNPALVGAYRLIGYENRRLASEDFNDDKKDAGEIGVGHTVTALYEILPPDAKDLPTVDALKYQSQSGAGGAELATIKLRYKPKGAKHSMLVEQPVTGPPLALDKTSDDFRFASAVAGFAMLLGDAQQKGQLDYPLVIKLAAASRGTDADGYRGEFVRLVESAATLTKYRREAQKQPQEFPQPRPLIKTLKVE